MADERDGARRRDIEAELRAVGRAARAESIAELDVDAELAALRAVADAATGRAMVGVEPLDTGAPGRRPVPYLAAAAALILIVGAGVVLLASTDDQVRVDDPSSSSGVATDPPAPTSIPSSAPDTAPDVDSTTPEVTTTTITTTSEPAPTTTEGSAPVTGTDWRTLPWESSGIPVGCEGCTQLRVGPTGATVTYDRETRALVRHDQPSTSVTLTESYGQVWVTAIGPDDVVYLEIDADGSSESARDVVAVSIAPDDAGREVGRWEAVIGSSGDSELVPTADGLVVVDCCGLDSVRPAPPADVVVPWLDRSGTAVSSTTPSIEVEIAFPELTVRRTDPVNGATRSWTYEPGPDWQPRGMPRIVPTFDGGFLAAEYGSSGELIARGWADGTVDQVILGDGTTFTDALDPAGRLLIADAGTFASVRPVAAERSERWDGQPAIAADGSVDLPGIDDALLAAPAWAESPVAFAVAVSPAAALAEQTVVETTEIDTDRWSVTRTASSAAAGTGAADRWTFVVERDPGTSRLAFVSGTWTFRCPNGQGHQDFSNEPCA